MAAIEIKPEVALVPVGCPDTDGQLVYAGDKPNEAIRVNVVATTGSSGGDGAILDGANSAIKATVFDLTNSNPLATQLVDSNGDPVSVGGGTQYAEDTAHVSGDQVTMAGVVQQTADAALSSDGDRSLLQVDESGFLKVNLKAGSVTVDVPADVTNTGDVSSLNGTVELNLQGRPGVGLFYTTVDFDGTFILEGSNDGGTTWAIDNLIFYRGDVPLASFSGGVSPETFEFSVMPMSAMTHVRARVDNYNSGTATFTLRGGQLIYDPMTAASFSTSQPTSNESGLVVREAARGQATMAVSIPVVIASNQSAVPVSGTVSVTEPVTVDANDLDIRNLLFATDKVDATGTVLGAGTNNIGDVDVLTLPSIPAGNNNIGDVDVATIAAGDNLIGRVKISDGTDVALVTAAGELNVVGTVAVTQATASNLNAQVVGAVAHDSAVSGNPVLVAASSETMADSAPANRTTADAEVTRMSATDGALFVVPTGPQTWSYHENSSSALTDITVHASPGAGLSLYITSIIFSTGAATPWNIFFEEGASTILGPWYLEAVAGRGAALHFGTPKKVTAATALTVTTSAAIAHSIDVQGFIAPG